MIVFYKIVLLYFLSLVFAGFTFFCFIVLLWLECKNIPIILNKLNLLKRELLVEKRQEHEYKELKVRETLVLAAIAILFPYIIFLIFALMSDMLDSDYLYKLGGSLQGVTAPFSAGIAAILTFIAFWTQYSANKILIEDNRRQETSRRFYEMLKIHKNNVSELIFTRYSRVSDQNVEFENIPITERKGREIFKYYKIEFDFLYKFICIVDGIPNEASIESKRNALVIAYNIFYKKSYRSYAEMEFLLSIGNTIFQVKACEQYKTKINEIVNGSSYDMNKKAQLKIIFYELWNYKIFFGLQRPFIGHFELLNHYYRHLYLMVKLVADDSDLSYKAKRNLLRILRAQLTGKEQLMLFYNWISGNGCQWEALKENLDKPNAVLNNYFTRYRMIHNIIPEDVVFCSNSSGDKQAKEFIQMLKECCDDNNLPPKMCKKKEFDNDNEVLFQFEDWYPKGSLGFEYPTENERIIG